MEITLRKAGQIESAIQNRVDELFRQVGSSISVSIYADAPMRRRIAKERMTERLERIGRLATIRCGLRSTVGKSNAVIGVSDRLAEMNHLQDVVKRLSALSKVEPALDDAELQEELKGQQKNFETVSDGYRGGTIEVGLFLQEDVDGFDTDLRATRRQIVKLNDELAEKNANATIAIADEDVELLQSEGIL